MLNINDLVVFLEAAKSDNYSQTATKIGLSQPAVSQKIKKLEDRFGVTLFEREGHFMRLTDAGQTLDALTRELVISSNELEVKPSTELPIALKSLGFVTFNIIWVLH